MVNIFFVNRRNLIKNVLVLILSMIFKSIENLIPNGANRVLFGNLVKTDGFGNSFVFIRDQPLKWRKPLKTIV